MNSTKLIIPRLSLCVHLCDVISPEVNFLNGNVYNYREIRYFFKKKKQLFEELQLKNTSSNVSDSLQMNSACYIFKSHALDFKSYLKVLGNLESKICTFVETRYFIFQIISRTTKNVENSGARILNFYQVLFIYKK